MITVGQIAERVRGFVEGDAALELEGAATLDKAGPRQLSYVESDKRLEEARRSGAGCLILPEEMTLTGRTCVRVRRPRLAFAKALALLYPDVPRRAGVHPSAVVDPTSTLEDGVYVGPHAVVGPRVKVGRRTVIGPGCYLGEGCELGEDCRLFARVTLYPGVRLLNRVVLHAGCVIGADGFGYVEEEDGSYSKFPQIGTVLLEDDVEVGANTCIDRGALDVTVVRRGTKIDNLVQVAHNVVVGEHCVIAAQTGISGSSLLEDRVVVGGQVGIADHVTIRSGAVLGAQAGIPSHKIIRRGQFVWGTPARPMDEFKEMYGNFLRLPKLRQEVELLKRKLVALERRSAGT
ncbi:MAG: UDP-3-O-(3-hydroxymyristoyl)glucosamine N-acyltransferase [Acidobacteria bacterium]|nr:UDP-3-O-(3-hydroxymyristoyl)glucosamine N-acyltransferase [Acidobacteriota bacterium]